MEASARDQELRKFVAPEIMMGPGARRLVGRYARNLGASRVLVVSDRGVAAAGWTGEAVRDLERAGLTTEVLLEVSPNPRDFEVMAGARRFRRAGCDTLVAVGGGSPIDCAKGLGIVATNGGAIADYEGVDRITAPMPPLLCIPTTGGTSADLSQFAIITDVHRRSKMAILSKAIVPDVSLVDPETLVTMSPALTAHTAFDALTHGIEAYVSNGDSPLTRLLAGDAIELVARYLLPCLAQPRDLELRGQLMRASMEAGLAFSNASLGIVHAMAHSMGGLLDLPHGLCNALLLPSGIRFNHAVVPDRYRAIASRMGLAPGADGLPGLVASLEALRAEAGIHETLGAVGVTRQHLTQLAELAARDACLATNPRMPSLPELEALYDDLL